MVRKKEDTVSKSKWLQAVRDRKAKSQTRVSPSKIIKARDANRK